MRLNDEATERSEFELGTEGSDGEVVLDRNLERDLGRPSERCRVGRALEEAALDEGEGQSRQVGQQGSRTLTGAAS